MKLCDVLSGALAWAGAMFAATALMAAYARSETIGAAYYGIYSPYWKCNESLGFFKGRREKAIETLWGTFGADMRCLSRFMSLPGPHLLVINPTNEACRGSGRCSPGEWAYGLSTPAIKRAVRARNARVLRELSSRVRRIREAHPWCSQPNVECVIGTGLEHRWSNEESKIIVETIRAEWPWAIMDNPVGGNPYRFRTDYVELHGVHPHPRGAYFVDNDGQDIRLRIAGRHVWNPASAVSTRQLREYVLRFRSRARAVFIWWSECNGKQGSRWVNHRDRRHFVAVDQVNAVRKAIGGL